MESLNEIKQFLDPSARLDLRDAATTYILSQRFATNSFNYIYQYLRPISW